MARSLSEGARDRERVVERIDWLSRRFLGRGECLIMGDLWPASVMVGEEGELGVIDWEFAHWGRPEQDVGHLMAHLWMWRHVGVVAAKSIARAFIDAYRARARWDQEHERAARIHMGCEIAARALGPFRQGYVYEACDRAVVDEAEHVARAYVSGEVKDLVLAK